MLSGFTDRISFAARPASPYLYPEQAEFMIMGRSPCYSRVTTRDHGKARRAGRRPAPGTRHPARA